MKYRDMLGASYEVSSQNVDEFERRRGILLRIAIGLKVLIIAGLIYLGSL